MSNVRSLDPGDPSHEPGCDLGLEPATRSGKQWWQSYSWQVFSAQAGGSPEQFENGPPGPPGEQATQRRGSRIQSIAAAPAAGKGMDRSAGCRISRRAGGPGTFDQEGPAIERAAGTAELPSGTVGKC